MEARVDFGKYPSAFSRGTNLLPLPQGGVTFRPGTRFVAEVRDSTELGALIPFEPSSADPYVLQFNDGFVRFYRNQGLLTTNPTDAVITNGSFTTNITGWTNISTGGASISYSSARMAMTPAEDGEAWAQQSIAVGAAYDTEHVIRFTLGGSPDAACIVQVGTSSGGSQLFRGTGYGIGWHTIAFTPSVTPFFFQVINPGPGVVFLDEVTILNANALELISPYAAADVRGIRVAQSADVLYLFHPNYAPRKIERRGDASWSIVTVFFEDGPWLGINPGTDLEALNLIENGSFDGGFAGWDIDNTGDAFVEFDSSQGVVFLRRHDTTGVGIMEQVVSTGAENTLHVMHFQIVGGGEIGFRVGSTDSGVDIVAATNYVAGWYTVSFTPAVDPFYIEFRADQDAAIVGGVGAVYGYNARANLLKPSATTGSVTVTAQGTFAPFALTDIGRSIRLEWPGKEPGWGVITGWTSTSVVTVQVIREFGSSLPTEIWRMGAWGGLNGWPRTGAFHQQRLFVARTTNQPQTVWSSQSQDFEHFRPDSWVEGASTVEDDDALDFTLASKKVSPIHWLVSSKALLVGTGSGQWAVGSRNAALTPTDFSAELQTTVGAADVAPVEIGTVALYVNRSNYAVYELGYDYEINGYRSADLTVLADHVAKPSGFAEIVYAGEPFSHVWARREGGTLCCLTYQRAQDVVGWTVMSTGTVESMAVIPGSVVADGQIYDSDHRDELWLIVRRTIGGVDKRYVEVMEGYYDPPNRAMYEVRTEWTAAVRSAQGEAFHVDCGLTYEGAATATISGLSHLNGQTVKVVADGAELADAVVTAGVISLDIDSLSADIATHTIHVGLPYGWVWRSLKLPYGAAQGPGVGANKTVSGMTFVLLGAATFEYGIDLDFDRPIDFTWVPFRRAADLMSSAVPLFTGEQHVNAAASGFSTDPRIVLKGNVPLPWTMLGIAPQVKANET